MVPEMVERVYIINDLLDDKKDVEITIEMLKNEEFEQRYIDREEKTLKFLLRGLRRERKELKEMVEQQIKMLKNLEEEMKVLDDVQV
uniref:Prefoldin subunit beta n=1 Tax=Caenorhabditis tropicalis TaxID=1561998 RepID=A0A1I7TBL1_9PELO